MTDGDQKAEYGKKTLWQWILIYLVIAIILYGLIYYFVFAKKADNSTNSYERPPNQTHSTLPNRQITIFLKGENNSGESGKVTLKQDNGVFTVTISLNSESSNIPQPAYIYRGKCPDVGAIKYMLNPVINGSSTTALQVSLDQLKKQEPLAITVHKSKQEITQYIACGDLPL